MCDTVLDIGNVYCGTVCDVQLRFFFFFFFLKSSGKKELWNRISVMYGFMNIDRNCGAGSG